MSTSGQASCSYVADAVVDACSTAPDLLATLQALPGRDSGTGTVFIRCML